MVIDLRNKNISGQKAQELLDKSGITVNKNTIPFDPCSPYNPSGIRLGTPAVTTRGMKEKEMKKIASWISQVIEKRNNETCSKVRREIIKFCRKFPIK